MLQNVTALLMEQLVHLIHVIVRVVNVRVNHPYEDEVVMNVKMDRLIYSVVVYSVAKTVAVTLAVLSIHFVIKELVSVNVIPE